MECYNLMLLRSLIPMKDELRDGYKDVEGFNHCSRCGAIGHNQRACPSKGLKGFATGVNPPPRSASGGKRSAKGGAEETDQNQRCILVKLELLDMVCFGIQLWRDNARSLPRAAWPAGITPKDDKIHARWSQPEVIIPLSGSQPLPSQDEEQMED
nr:hypothetical protein [Tanacetum cinerariifolium]